MRRPESIESGSEVDGIAAYEALRTHVMGEAPVGFIPLGLALLRRHGVGTWLAQERAARKPALSPHPAKPPEGARAPSSPTELIRLLAGTALMIMKARSR